ncbi:hypothetical protein RRG08_035677 [Elysia crispata]|uniref:Uncharacterized protein n=1 Tax=Elysia crispata TaxID=231223 RepID=A0AAE0YBK6_9GAST|nr:hypothetical protein RRG08_035677 [Elysia crispata]
MYRQHTAVRGKPPRGTAKEKRCEVVTASSFPRPRTWFACLDLGKRDSRVISIYSLSVMGKLMIKKGIPCRGKITLRQSVKAL